MRLQAPVVLRLLPAIFLSSESYRSLLFKTCIVKWSLAWNLHWMYMYICNLIGFPLADIHRGKRRRWMFTLPPIVERRRQGISLGKGGLWPQEADREDSLFIWYNWNAERGDANTLCHGSWWHPYEVSVACMRTCKYPMWYNYDRFSFV